MFTGRSGLTLSSLLNSPLIDVKYDLEIRLLFLCYPRDHLLFNEAETFPITSLVQVSLLKSDNAVENEHNVIVAQPLRIALR